MFKRLSVLLILIFVVSQQAPPPVEGQILQWACSTTASIDGGPYTILVCPAGDGLTLASIGATITVRLRDVTGMIPIVGVPASDYWLFDCNDQVALCGGSNSINADAASDADGMATISDAIAAGGQGDGTLVFVQGVFIEDCDFNPLCLPIVWRSPDINGDLIVDLVDFSIFGPAFPSPPSTYNPAADMDNDGIVDIVDFSIFGGHFLHRC